jgi:hypothetical protein
MEKIVELLLPVQGLFTKVDYSSSIISGKIFKSLRVSIAKELIPAELVLPERDSINSVRYAFQGLKEIRSFVKFMKTPLADLPMKLSYDGKEVTEDDIQFIVEYSVIRYRLENGV